MLCDACKGNVYSDTYGATDCPYCPEGKQAENWQYNSTLTDDTASDLDPGTRSTKCVNCPTGKFSTWYNEDGHLDNTYKRRGCFPCVLSKGLGYTADAGSTSCKKCPAGKRGNDNGICIDCTPGKYAKNEGESVCNECTAYGYTELPSEASGDVSSS
jgi:hypothetical protein